MPDLMDVPDFFGESDEQPDAIREPERRPYEASEALVEHDEPFLVAPRSPGLVPATKPGVRLPTRSEMALALRVAAMRGDVITSGQDSAHLKTSLHYDGLAVDIRPAKDTVAQIRAYRQAGYTVLPEGIPDPDKGGRVAGLTPGVGTAPHLHVSLDPEGRRV